MNWTRTCQHCKARYSEPWKEIAFVLPDRTCRDCYDYQQYLESLIVKKKQSEYEAYMAKRNAFLTERKRKAEEAESKKKNAVIQKILNERNGENQDGQILVTPHLEAELKQVKGE